MERTPEFTGDEQVLPLDHASRNHIFQCLADLLLILIAKSAVNMSVSALNRVDNRFLHLPLCTLPGTQSKGGNGSASVEFERCVHGGRGMEYAFWGLAEDEVCERGVHGMYSIAVVGVAKGIYGKVIVSGMMHEWKLSLVSYG